MADGAQTESGRALPSRERSSSPSVGKSGAGIEQLCWQLAPRIDGLSAAPVKSS